MGVAVHLVIAANLQSSNLPSEYCEQGADVMHIIADQFGISDARSLYENAYKSAMSDGQRVFVIVTQKLTVEAQNALLKLFEEPPERCEIYLVVPHESLIIPTLRSRFVDSQFGVSSDDGEDAVEFLASDYKDRLALIADKAKAKDGVWMEGLVTKLASEIKRRDLSKDLKVQQSLALVESYVSIRGASRKMLLEELALSLPVISTR